MKSKKEEKICKICQLEILEKDNYLELKDYIRGKFKGSSYYHQACFKEKLSGKAEIKSMLSNMYAKTNYLANLAIEKLGGENVQQF